MSTCRYCGKETGNRLKYCNHKCRVKYNRAQRNLDYHPGDSYDPYLALWVATLVPEHHIMASKTLSNPKILSNVGHILLDRISTEMCRYGNIPYFQKLYQLEGGHHEITKIVQANKGKRTKGSCESKNAR